MKREREQRANGLGMSICFYWDGGWGPRVSKSHSLMVNLKQEWEFKRGGEMGEKRETSGPNGQLSKPTKIYQRSLSGGRCPGCSSSSVASNLFIQDRYTLFFKN